MKRPVTTRNNLEEIREEEKKEERKTDASHLAQSDAGASLAQPPAEQERPVAFIPLADGSEYPVPVSLACEYATAYPGVNVMGEFGKARAWCLSNPRQRKTKNGIRRFLNGWMDKAQNNASRSSPAAGSGRPMTARQVEAAERGDFAEQVLKLDEVYRNGELAAFGSGTQQGVCALSAAEARYAGYLDGMKHTGEVVAWAYEAVKLRLADKTFYTPDFVVIRADGGIELHEVKGHWEDDARVKIKVAATQHPWFRFLAVKAGKTGWQYETFGGGA